MTTNKITEAYEFTHKGISMVIHIDYIKNNISILESVDEDTGTPKKFVFANRGVEYMEGWRNILEAVTEATKDAEKRYEDNLAEVSKFKEEKMQRIAEMIAEDEAIEKSTKHTVGFVPKER